MPGTSSREPHTPCTMHASASSSLLVEYIDSGEIQPRIEKDKRLKRTPFLHGKKMSSWSMNGAVPPGTT
ncbi:hypothetical protein J6590_021624 [Homalodisca vitripennis]|nr:hypothetical protein J6590_021624 [Homalodisca vitripennis]